jgi:hypothetical protein
MTSASRRAQWFRESETKGSWDKKLVDLKFVGALSRGEPLQHYVFRVRYPGRVHDETALEIMPVSAVGKNGKKKKKKRCPYTPFEADHPRT